jgi:hypothetical protein
MLVHFMAIWNILQLFGISYGHLVLFVVVWCIFFRFGMLYQEKSGNPANDVLVIFWREKVAGKEIGILD